MEATIQNRRYYEQAPEVISDVGIELPASLPEQDNSAPASAPPHTAAAPQRAPESTNVVKEAILEPFPSALEPELPFDSDEDEDEDEDRAVADEAGSLSFWYQVRDNAQQLFVIATHQIEQLKRRARRLSSSTDSECAANPAELDVKTHEVRSPTAGLNRTLPEVADPTTKIAVPAESVQPSLKAETTVLSPLRSEVPKAVRIVGDERKFTSAALHEFLAGCRYTAEMVRSTYCDKLACFRYHL
jgi:hypothetical protein